MRLDAVLPRAQCRPSHTDWTALCPLHGLCHREANAELLESLVGLGLGRPHDHNVDLERRKNNGAVLGAEKQRIGEKLHVAWNQAASLRAAD